MSSVYLAKPAGATRIVSLNVNGLRASVNKGLLDWMQAVDGDIFCLQETRLQAHQWVDTHKPAGWFTHLCAAKRPGYSGTAIYSRWPLSNIQDGLGFGLCDDEGRYTEATLTLPNEQIIVIASVYFPSGASSELAQARKNEFLQRITPILQAWQQHKRPMIICSDVNIAHTKLDLKNWSANQATPGFLPHERAWLDTLYGPLEFCDAFRLKNKQPEHYTWWSNRGQSWANNVGWRIDYQIIAQYLAPFVHQVFIDRSRRLSDHAPVVIDYLF